MSNRKAIAHLRRADPVIARVIERVGNCTFAPRAEGTHFEAVARAIVYQQLSGKAASTIHARVAGAAGGTVTAAALRSLDDATLRAAGLSRQKIGYLRDLAELAVTGAIPIESLHELPDEEVIAALTSVRGVGRWTAQMFLMFRLGRPDVLPELDLGIRKGVQRAYRLRSLPLPKRVTVIGARWAPYRTIASWYLWRLLDADAATRQGG